MSASLEGRTALVTGGASGIGLATVKRLAAAGARVSLAFHPDHPPAGEAEAEALRKEGLDVHAIAADVSDPASVETLFESVRERSGSPDIVVANASIAPRTSSDQLDLAAWRQVMETNLTGGYQTLMRAVPDMLERGFGRLLVTASVSGPLVAWPEHAAYCATKAGLVGLVRGLAVDLAPGGITVNAVAPGLVRTPMSLDPVDGLGARRIDEVAEQIPARRAGEPDDIAAVFEFLAGAGASYITGQLIVVDGGSALLEAT